MVDQDTIAKLSSIVKLYEELRTEFDHLNKIQDVEDKQGRRYTYYGDPARLSQIERRLMVRTAFAFIEGMTYSLKVLALTYKHSNQPLTIAEQLYAQEQEPTINQHGVASLRKAKITTLVNIKFAFALLNKAIGGDFILDISGLGWQSVQKAIKVRDRLMHPKQASCVYVSDEEAQAAVISYLWFDQQFFALLTDMSRRATASRAQLAAQSELDRKLSQAKQQLADMLRSAPLPNTPENAEQK